MSDTWTIRITLILATLCAIPLMEEVGNAQPLPDDAARQHKLDLQERCAQAAEKSFRSSGWKPENGSATKVTTIKSPRPVNRPS